VGSDSIKAIVLSKCCLNVFHCFRGISKSQYLKHLNHISKENVMNIDLGDCITLLDIRFFYC